MENLHKNVSIEQLQGLMADLIVSQREAKDERLKDAKQKIEDDKKFRAEIKEIYGELGGIGKSNGEIAENFFSTALGHKMQVGKLKFDYIDFNMRRKRNNTEAEYDVILYNHYKVLIVEIKYNFRLDQVRDFHTRRLKRFRTLFPEYKNYKVYGAIAALSYEKNVIDEAHKYGFFVLAQNNDKIKIANINDFVPSEVK